MVHPSLGLSAKKNKRKRRTMENRLPIFTDSFIQIMNIQFYLHPVYRNTYINCLSQQNEVTMESSYRLFLESYLASTKISLPNARHSTTSHFRTVTERAEKLYYAATLLISGKFTLALTLLLQTMRTIGWRGYIRHIDFIFTLDWSGMLVVQWTFFQAWCRIIHHDAVAMTTSLPLTTNNQHKSKSADRNEQLQTTLLHPHHLLFSKKDPECHAWRMIILNNDALN